MKIGQPRVDWGKQVIESIPWTGIAGFMFLMLFFGIDFAAGITYQAKLMTQDTPEGKKLKEEKEKEMKKKVWALESTQTAREGALHRP